MAIEVITSDDLKEALTPLVKEIKSLRTEIISQRRAVPPEWLTVAEAAKAVKCSERPFVDGTKKEGLIQCARGSGY